MVFSPVTVSYAVCEQPQKPNLSVVRDNLQSSQMKDLTSNGCKVLWVVTMDVRALPAYERYDM